MNLPINIEDILKNKLGPQIKAMGLTTEDEINDYIEEYLQSSGEDFQKSLQNQIVGIKSQFESVVQKTITLSSNLVSIPSIMANPVTVNVANQLLQEVIGDTKSLLQDISQISSKTISLIGSAPKEIDALGNKVDELKTEAQDKLVIIQVVYNGVTQDTDPNNGIIYQCTSSQSSNILEFIPKNPGHTAMFMGTIPFGNIQYQNYIEDGWGSNGIKWGFSYSEVPEGTTNFEIQITYQEESDLDELGNPIYTDNIKIYSGQIIK